MMDQPDRTRTWTSVVPECVKVLSKVLGPLIEHITNAEESIVLQDEGIWAYSTKLCEWMDTGLTTHS